MFVSRPDFPAPIKSRVKLVEMSSYTVEIPVFEGPLDLLLHLIERAELDITKVAIAQVTDQYLAYLKSLQNQSPDDVSGFLVLAARLIQIKSEALLPRPPVREEGEEDPGEALARQLQLYKKFKDLAKWIGKREAQGLRTYIRLAPPPKVEGKIDLSGLGIDDLVRAAEEVYSRYQAQEGVGRVVVSQRFTIRDKIRMIVDRLRRGHKTNFRGLIGRSRSRVEVVVTFLAVLELVKRDRIFAHQEGLFNEIELEPIGEWDEAEEFEIEFLD